MNWTGCRMLIVMLTIALLAFGCGEGPRERWSSGYVEANGIKLHYWRTGDRPGKPLIVAIHGITDNGLCWTSLVMDLASRYDFILYDARGHGLSDKPESGYRMEDHVEDLAGLIGALKLDRPILLGHSMGGAIAALTAVKYPELPLALILEDPAWLEAPEDPAAQTEEFRKWLESVHGRSVADLMEMVQEENPEWPFDDWKPWAESKTQVSLRVVRTYQDLPALVEYFPSIELPTLIIKADADAAERAHHVEIAGLLPAGKLVHIDGAGHSVHRDKPFATRAAIHDFLRAEPLWQVGAKYREARSYTLEVSAEGHDWSARRDLSHDFSFTRSRDASGHYTSSIRFEGTGTGAAPETFGEHPPPTEWLEFDRGGWGANGVHRSGSARADSAEYQVISAWAPTQERIEYWIDRETGLVERFIQQGPVRWTLRIESTHFED